MAAYVPQQGDLVALDFDPQSGHEKDIACTAFWKLPLE